MLSSLVTLNAPGPYYHVEIDGTGTGVGGVDKFAWFYEQSADERHSCVPITGAKQQLDEHVSILFKQRTGHTQGDKWTGSESNRARLSISGHFGLSASSRKMFRLDRVFRPGAHDAYAASVVGVDDFMQFLGHCGMDLVLTDAEFPGALIPKPYLDLELRASQESKANKYQRGEADSSGSSVVWKPREEWLDGGQHSQRGQRLRALKLLHTFGVVMHFDGAKQDKLRDFVFLKVQWLADLVEGIFACAHWLGDAQVNESEKRVDEKNVTRLLFDTDEVGKVLFSGNGSKSKKELTEAGRDFEQGLLTRRLLH